MNRENDKNDKTSRAGGGGGLSEEGLVDKKPQFSCATFLRPSDDTVAHLPVTPRRAHDNWARKTTPLLFQSTAPSEGKTCARFAVEEGREMPLYPLDRPTEIEATAHLVAARIDDCLRMRSVQAKFDVENAEARCTTSTFLIYTVRLFAGQEQGCTVVEVQRRQGCSVAFRNERAAILNAAKGFGSSTPPKMAPLHLSIPEDLMCHYKAPSDEEIRSLVDRASEHLHSNKLDLQLFGLQNMAAMTDTVKSHAPTAHKISDIILTGDNCFANVLMSSCTEEIRNAALSVLRNTMDSLTFSKKLSSLLDDKSQWVEEQLVPSLVEDIRKSSSCPHNACLALRCLCLLLKSSGKVRSQVDAGVLTEAENIGKTSHFDLQKVAQSARQLQCQ
jgi:hypothetical protein